MYTMNCTITMKPYICTVHLATSGCPKQCVAIYLEELGTLSISCYTFVIIMKY